MVLWAGTGVGARATTRASGPARARGRCLGTLEPVVSPVRACSCGTGKRAGHQPAVSPVRAFGERYGTASERGRPAYQQKSTPPGATSTGGSPSGGPVDGATRRAPLLNAGRPRNRHPRRYRCSRFWKGLERSESVSRGPALRVGFFAGTGVLASGKVWKEAKASLVVQPYGSASSPSLAASCAISPVRARSCGTGKRAGRAKPAGASERRQPRASGHTTLKKCFTLFGCAKQGNRR
jgi:hypothetical protein